MDTPRYNPANPSAVPAPVSGGNQPTGAFGDQGRFGVTTYRPLRVPPPRITPSVDEDNTEIIREGNSPQSGNEEGISDQKPDIILVSEFKPLYNKQTVFRQSIFSDTPAKKYFDTILETRRLKAENSFLEYDRIASSSPEIKSKFSKIFQQNANLVSFLRDKFSSIIEIHADVERFKSFLDPRSRKVYLDDELRRNFSRISTREDLEENIGGESVLIEVKDLLEEIGFNLNNFKFYSNTKVLAQIMHEYENICNNWSYYIRERLRDDQSGGLNLLNRNVFISGFRFGSSGFSISNLPYKDRFKNYTQIIKNHFRFFDGKTRIFENNGLLNDKFFDFIKILSTEFSVSFSLKQERGQGSDLFKKFDLIKTGGFDVLDENVNVITTSPFVVLRDQKKLTFEPSKIGDFSTVMNVSNLETIKNSSMSLLEKIKYFESFYVGLFKQFGGFCPLTIEGDYSQFSSKSLFENIYYRFYDVDHNPKWNLEEVSSYVFSVIPSQQPVDEAYLANFNRGETDEDVVLIGANGFKYRIFSLLIADLANKSDSEYSTIRTKVWDDFFDEFTNDFNDSGSNIPSFQLNQTDFNISFSKSNDVNFFKSYKNEPSTGNENLFQVISKTLKEFNFFINEFCSDDGESTLHRGLNKVSILLFVFEIIVTIISGGFKKFVTSSKWSENILYFSSNTESQSHIFNKVSFNSAISKFQEHDNKIRKLFSFISGYMRQTREEIEKIQRKIDNPALQDFLSDMGDLIINPQISSKQQSSISLNSLLDLEPLFVNSEMRTESNLPSYKFVNSSIMGEKTKSAFFSLMKNDKFLNEGRIISVGIPNGFFDQILYSPKELNSRWSYSQKDIVKLKIYKIELTRPDIVFLPVIKEFELSRLIARDDSYLLFDGRGSYDVSVGQFPTRDFDNTGDKNSVQYFHPDPEKRSIRIVTRGDFEIFQALTGNSYDEILNADKIKIYNNHIESYLLEIYTRIMSGISLAEGNISDFSGITPQNLQQNLKKILSDPGIVLENFESFDRVDPNNPSTLSSTEQIALNILSPKPYDRVLNVLVRSDDFIIDFIKTTNLNRRFVNSFLDTDTDIEKFLLNGLQNYKLKPREYSFESYFVTIETGSGGVI